MKCKKSIISLFLFSLTVVGACSTLPSLVLKFNERTWQLCQEQQIKDLKLSRDFGYACYHYCTKYKWLSSHISANCKIWTTDVLDMGVKEDFIKLRDAGFILKVEGR